MTQAGGRSAGGSIINITIGVDPETIWAMSNSLASLGLVLASDFEGHEPVAERLAMLMEAVDIFSFEDRVGPAGVAEIVSALRLAPSHGYLDLCAAMVRDGHADAGAVDHGWPILVLRGVSAQPTIAEGGAVGSPVLNNCDRAPGGPRA